MPSSLQQKCKGAQVLNSIYYLNPPFDFSAQILIKEEIRTKSTYPQAINVESYP